jgi:5-methyltetrahydrofolate--homocysteine methyltransferase
MSDFKGITEALIAGNTEKIKALVQNEVDKGSDGNDILNNGLIKGMDIVGGKMQSGEMFIPEVLMSAYSMREAVVILKPLLAEEDMGSAGHVLIGSVKGDLHDIGKNLVAMMIESSGFQVTDLGVDVAPETFVKEIQEKKPTIVGLSALLTTTLPMMQKTIEAINESGLRDSVKILVGGAPVNQEFADKIGADGFAPDAGSASKVVKKLWNRVY